MMTKHIVVQRRPHRFAYLIIQNTGNITLAETTSEAYSYPSIWFSPQSHIG